MGRKKYLIPLLLLLYPSVCFGDFEEDGPFYVSTTDYQQGLSNSAVMAIFQDNSELMWFGTYDGVNCYDGKTIEVYRSDFSEDVTLDNNVIHNICQADGNCLWISTFMGINRFSLDTRQVVTNYEVGTDTYVFSNSSGNTWMAAEDGVYYYNTLYQCFVRVHDLPYATSCISRRCFVTEDGDLRVFPPESGEMVRFTVESFAGDTLSETVNITSSRIHHKAVGHISYHDNVLLCLVDSDNDLYLYDTSLQSKIFIRNIGEVTAKYGLIESIVPFYNDIIIAFQVNGLVRLRGTMRYEEEPVGGNVSIFCVYKDPRQGTLWIGTDGQGAVMYTKKSAIATNLMLWDLSPNIDRQVRSIMTDQDGSLWFGTKGDGLVCVRDYREVMKADAATVYFPGSKQKASTYRDDPGEFRVFSLNRSGYMDGFWVGTGAEGLLYYEPGDDLLHSLGPDSLNPKAEIYAVHESLDTALYVATRELGLLRLTLDRTGSAPRITGRHKYNFYYEQQAITMFFSMVSDGDSLLWLGSRGKGLIRFDKRTEEYQVVSLRERLNKAVDDVLCICRLENGQMYVGTTSGLVCITFEGGRMNMRHIGREQGLLNDMVHGIIEDPAGFLWLSTNKGLIKYDPVDGSSHAYYYSGGLKIREFSDGAYFKDPGDGRIFFGGIDGLLYINEDVASDFDHYPEIVLRKLLFGKREANIADHYTPGRDGLRFDYHDNSFSLQFIAPDYATGPDLEYSYILDGYDEDWKPFGSITEASYTAVPPGEYVFRVRYKKDIFNSQYKGFSMPLTISSLWHKTLWAHILFGILLAAVVSYMVYLGYKYYQQKQLVSKLSESERGIVAGHRSDHRNRETMEKLTAVYHACDQLRAENAGEEQRLRTVTLIRENIMSVMFPDAILSGRSAGELRPGQFLVAGYLNIRATVNVVIEQLRIRGIDSNGIEVTIPADFTFPVYKNAVGYILDYIFTVASYYDTGTLTVDAHDEGGRMNLTFASGAELVEDLLVILSGHGEPIPVKGDAGAAHAFGMQMMQGFIRSVLAQIGAVVTVSRSKQVNKLNIQFPPARTHESRTARKTLLLLEDHDSMSLLLGDILCDDYVIHRVGTIQQAFDYLRNNDTPVFLVNMFMYSGVENTLLEYVGKNSTLLEKTAFIPMITWERRVSLNRELIPFSDSFIVLPYGISFLREIIDNAVYGKKKAKRIYIEELGELGNLVTCTTEEQSEFVRKIIRIIDKNIDVPDLGSTLIADRMAMSPRNFYRRFKEISGMPPADLIKNYRMEKAAALLKDPSLSIQDVISDVGISSRSYFYREFTRRFGMTPKDFRQQNLGNSHANSGETTGPQI